MYNIEPKQTTVIHRSVVITLDEDEIAQILVDPRKFQKELRSVKSMWSNSVSTWSATGQAPKASEKKMGRGRTPKIPCEVCGKLVGAQGMHKHLAKHQRAANAD
jgi:hypothetical protein